MNKLKIAGLCLAGLAIVAAVILLPGLIPVSWRAIVGWAAISLAGLVAVGLPVANAYAASMRS